MLYIDLNVFLMNMLLAAGFGSVRGFAYAGNVYLI